MNMVMEGAAKRGIMIAATEFELYFAFTKHIHMGLSFEFVNDLLK
jgi:hypothetical protein